MSCNYCEKRGLPILPVRTAVVKKSLALPALPDEFKVEIPPTADITYTSRLLRPGYLYVYDEKRNKWTDYQVTEQGFYCKCPGKAQPLPSVCNKKNCTDPGEVSRSSFITIPVARESQNLGRFWFAWSDYLWTDNVRKQYASEAVRNAHMQCLDLKQWLSSRRNPHAVSMSRLTQVVAEYSPKQPGASVFNLYQAPWLGKEKQPQAQSLLDAAIAINGVPFKMDASLPLLLSIPDVSGIARDLATLIAESDSVFMAMCQRKDKAFARKFALNTMISTMEYNVKEHHKLALSSTGDGLVNSTAQGLHHNESTWGMFSEDENKQQAELVRQYLNKRLAEGKKSEAYWQGYQKYYNEGEQQRFTKNLKEEDKEFTTQYIDPLVKMYLQWVKSALFADYFEMNFDPEDMKGGAHYTLTVAACMAGGQEKGEIFKYYRQCLGMNVSDTRNPIMRAFILNQAQLAKQFSPYSSGATLTDKGLSLPWDSLIASVSTILEELSKNGVEALAQLNVLSLTLAGPILAMLSDPVSKKVNQLPIILSVMEKSPLVRVSKTSTVKNLTEALTLKVVTETFDGAGLSPAKRIQAKTQHTNLARAKVQQSGLIGEIVELDSKIREGGGANMKAKATSAHLLLLTEDLDKQLKGKTPSQRIDIMLGNTKTTEKAHDYYLKNKLSNTATGGSVIAVLFQSAAIASMIKQEKFWLGGISTPSAMKLSASWAGVTGGVLELSVSAIKLMPIRGSGIVAFWSLKVEKFGKILGIAGAVVIAFCDFWEMGNQAIKGNYGMATLYAISGFAGGILAYSLFKYMATENLMYVARAFRLSVILIAIAFLIEYFTPNKLQEWLTKTLWGTDHKLRFTSEEEESKQFQALWNIE